MTKKVVGKGTKPAAAPAVAAPKPETQAPAAEAPAAEAPAAEAPAAEAPAAEAPAAEAPAGKAPVPGPGQEGWIPIRYVGGKKRETDHNYGSNVEWTEKGQIKLVPPASAIKLLKHPEFQDARHNFQRGKPIKVADSAAKSEEEEQHPLISLENSTKAEIVLYAKRNFGLDLDTSVKKDELINRVRNLMNGTR